MPRPPNVKMTRYVEITESAMAAHFAVDLWAMRHEDRTALILVALDAEVFSTPENAESFIEAAVYDCWKDMKYSRRKRSRQ